MLQNSKIKIESRKHFKQLKETNDKMNKKED